jgi:cyanophycin synthetase
VVGDQLVAAARRDPPHVIGDGVHTVRELVDQVNADPRRGEGHATSLTKIRIDDIAVARLALQGFDARCAGQGSARHPAQQRQPVHRRHRHRRDRRRAPRSGRPRRRRGPDGGPAHLRRGRGGETVLRPLEEQGGGIVEVNAAPGLRMHLAPSYGKPRRG